MKCVLFWYEIFLCASLISEKEKSYGNEILVMSLQKVLLPITASLRLILSAAKNVFLSSF